MLPNQTDTNPPGYHLRVENFGKLTAADIRVGDFTVLAGPNNTGKSFVSKLLYSVFSALDVDLCRTRVLRLVSTLTRHVAHLREERPPTDRLRRMAEEMQQVALSYSSGEIESLGEAVTRLNQEASKMEALVVRATSHIADTSNSQTQRLDLSNLRESLQQFTSALENADPCAFSIAELQYRTTRALTMNFQVPDMASLASVRDEEIVVKVAELLQLTACGDRLDVRADDSVLAPPSGQQNVIYIESPVYWKLFDALQDVRRFPTYLGRRGRERLTGVPDYFYELAEAIKRKYTGEMSFPDVHRQLVGNDMINGKVALSESGDIVFEEAGRSFPLVTAAAGVANIGFLAMLIERKAIDRGTMLFIDEPEAHLHPAWQVVVAQALFQLAREGVRVVLATHSMDILKWLEVHLKRNPDDAKYVALNRFPNPVFGEEDVATKIADIKDDLTKPFVDLYLRGL